MTDAVKHTPTPWHVHDESIHAQYDLDGGTEHYWVASTGQPDERPNPEQLANARFIVRAVNSHDALLEALLSIRDLYGPEGDYARNAVETWNYAEAAIALAQKDSHA